MSAEPLPLQIGLTQDRHGHWVLKAFHGAEELPGHATVDIDADTTRHMLESGLNKLLKRHPGARLSIEVEDEMRRQHLALDPATHRVRRISKACVAAPPATTPT